MDGCLLSQSPLRAGELETAAEGSCNKHRYPPRRPSVQKPFIAALQGLFTRVRSREKRWTLSQNEHPLTAPLPAKFEPRVVILERRLLASMGTGQAGRCCQPPGDDHRMLYVHTYVLT